MASPPTLVIGETLTDVLCAPDGSRRSQPGGSPANVALGLARLGYPTHLATRIGQDLDGSRLHDHLRSSGVELTEGSVAPGTSSTATARLGPDGSASYTFDLTWDLPAGTGRLLRDGAFGHTHTGSLATALAPGAEKVATAVREAVRSVTVSYDPNLRPTLLRTAEEEQDGVEAFVGLSDVVKASQEDLAWLYPGLPPEATADRWARSGPSLVVLTRGAQGASCFWRAGRVDVALRPVKVADTVGAGDAFMAGLLSGLLTAGLLGAPEALAESTPRTRLRAATDHPDLDPAVAAALARANLVAALTCSRPGADPPTAAELADLEGGLADRP